jgi:hypothetical protein
MNLKINVRKPVLAIAFVFLGYFLSLSTVPRSEAMIGGLMPPSGLCAADPYSGQDGCAGANPNSTKQIASLLNGYTATPAWWSAGVKYPVSYYTPLASLTECNSSSCPGLPACAATGSSGGNNYVLIASAPCTLSGYHFDGVCVGWNVSSGIVTITDNLFTVSASCNPAGENYIGYPNAGSETGTQNVIFTFNEIDQTYTQNDSSNVSFVATFDGGTATVEYNWAHNGYGNVFRFDCGNSSCSATEAFNLITDFGGSTSHSDGQYFDGSSGTAYAININYNTISYQNPSTAAGTSPLNPVSQISANLIQVAANIENNTVIVNTSGGPGAWGGATVYCCATGYGPSGTNITNNFVDNRGQLEFMYSNATFGAVSSTCHGNVNMNDGTTITQTLAAFSCN